MTSNNKQLTVFKVIMMDDSLWQVRSYEILPTFSERKNRLNRVIEEPTPPTLSVYVEAAEPDEALILAVELFKKYFEDE